MTIKFYSTEVEEQISAAGSYSCQLEKEERRSVFAERLKEAMDRAEKASSESADTDFR